MIDISAREVTRTIDLQQYRRPHGIAWLRGSEVAVTTEGSKTLLVVDVAATRREHSERRGH